MNKKALIIVHANGRYDKESRCHCIMEGASVDLNFYDMLIKEIESNNYEEIIYRINLGNCVTKEDVDNALKTDPILSKLNKETREKITIIREGAGLSKEFDNYLERMELENLLVEQNFEFVFAGLYYDLCVKSHAEVLQSRHPNARIQRPECLSRWSSERAKYDRNKCIGVGQIGRRTQSSFGRDTVGIATDCELISNPFREARGD